VHALPVHRSTVIDVALVAVLVHVRPILRRVLELAARFAGAVGGLDVPWVTLMDAEVVLEAPALSVTVRDAVYVPGALYPGSGVKTQSSGLNGLQPADPGEYRFCEAFYGAGAYGCRPAEKLLEIALPRGLKAHPALYTACTLNWANSEEVFHVPA